MFSVTTGFATFKEISLWSPYGMRQTIILLPSDFYLLLLLFFLA